ncbi:hypothetical protein JZ751_002537 [Albula glossodonta]|uniref:Transmembrane protein n=1 Tax=Albula glossodonta TaxID=121402 RepID=A0A8T2NA33_9TELE|nr:hypothetical protein JZ751_002537 [Albula glossodonta]
MKDANSAVAFYSQTPQSLALDVPICICVPDAPQECIAAVVVIVVVVAVAVVVVVVS